MTTTSTPSGVTTPGPVGPNRGPAAAEALLSRAAHLLRRRPLRSELVLVGGVLVGVLLVIVLALPQLGVSLWLDEATSVVYVRAPLRPFVQVVTGPELNQVLYYLLLRPWAALVSRPDLLFTDPVALRVPSLLFSILTVVVAGDAGRGLFAMLPWPGRRLAPAAGAVAAIAAGTNGMVASYGADARGYSLELLLVTASVAALLRLLAQPRPRTAVVWGVLAGLAAYAHFFALLPFAGVVLAVLLALPRGRVPLRVLVVGVLPLAVLVAPIVIYVVGHPGNTAWVGSPTTGRFTSALAVIAGGDAGGQQAGALGVLVAQTAVLVLALLVVIGVLDLVRAARSTGRSLETFTAALPLSLILTPFGLALGIGFFAPVFFSRYLIVCVPGVVLLVATTVARRLVPDLRPVGPDGARPGPWVPRSTWEKLTAGAATVGLLASVGLVALGVVGSARCSGGSCVRENWSAVADRISARARPGDVIVVYQADTVRPYLAAVDRLPAARRAAINGDVVWPRSGQYDPAGSHVQPLILKTVLTAEPVRVWLVLSHVAQSDRASSAGRIVSQLTSAFSKPTIKSFRGVEVLLFTARSG